MAPMDHVRKLILEKVDEHGTSLSEVSRAIGRNHAYLQQFIHRNIPRKLSEELRALIAQQLGIDENLLRNGTVHSVQSRIAESPPGGKRFVAIGTPNISMSPSAQKPHIESAQLVGERDLPVFGTAQGGKGAVVLSNDPVDWDLRPVSLLRVRDGYGIIVSGDSMSPEHKSGSTALVNPTLHPRSGNSCVFRNHADDGTVLICIKTFVRQTDDLWYVSQYNPKKSFTLKKSEWQVCHVTVGNYFRA